MRLGFIGPANADSDLLERAVKLLITDLEADAVVYLGADDAVRDFISAHAPKDTGKTFEQRVAEVAATGSAEEIQGVVRSLRGARYIEKLLLLPEPSARAVEMLDDRMIMIVREKSAVGEEDVINSNVVVYGDANELAFKRFGPRCFFSPGPLEAGHIGVLEDQSETGGVTLKAFDLSGEVWWTEPIQGRGAKMKVAP